MKFDIRGKNIAVTEALRDYVTAKITHIAKYFDQEPNLIVHAVLHVQREQQGVEVTIPMSHCTLRAEERGDDLYAAIDKVQAKLERQVRKYKTKLARKYRKPLERGGTAVLEAEYDSLDGEELQPARVKSFDLKPMDVEEAILQMNLLDHTFYVFRNAHNSKVEVVYKRAAGQYGLITH